MILPDFSDTIAQTRVQIRGRETMYSSEMSPSRASSFLRDPVGHHRPPPPTHTHTQKKVSTKKQREKKGKCYSHKSVKGAYSFSLSRDKSSRTWTKVCFHTKSNSLLSTESLLGSMRVKPCFNWRIVMFHTLRGLFTNCSRTNHVLKICIQHLERAN